MFSKGVTEKEASSDNIDFLLVVLWYLNIDCLEAFWTDWLYRDELKAWPGTEDPPSICKPEVLGWAPPRSEGLVRRPKELRLWKQFSLE
jgi:hypothetical protein